MPSTETSDTGLPAACTTVKPPGPGVCGVCCSGVDGAYPVCSNCHESRRQLGHPLEPVTPISLATPGSRLYRALRQYKSTRPVSIPQRRDLAALLALFFRRHLSCLAPDGIDTVLVVPSLSGRRPSPHPLGVVLGMVDDLPPALDCLHPGREAVGHRRAARDGIRVTRSLAGRRVLLVDDTCTTGAHLQSAASAVLGSGASAVHPVVIARFLRQDWPPSRRILRWSAAHPWHPDRCIRCAAPGGEHPAAERRGTTSAPVVDCLDLLP